MLTQHPRPNHKLSSNKTAITQNSQLLCIIASSSLNFAKLIWRVSWSRVKISIASRAPWLVIYNQNMNSLFLSEPGHELNNHLCSAGRAIRMIIKILRKVCALTSPPSLYFTRYKCPLVCDPSRVPIPDVVSFRYRRH